MKKGFTLKELLIVLAIIGWIVAIAAPRMSLTVQKANEVIAEAHAPSQRQIELTMQGSSEVISIDKDCFITREIENCSFTIEVKYK